MGTAVAQAADVAAPNVAATIILCRSIEVD
jgi:hypothetical protein